MLTSLNPSRQVYSCFLPSNALLWCMPYIFPHEDLFVYTISLLIIGLVYIRVRLIRRRRAQMDQRRSTG